jgi:P27 family predicted phage terminase small subunit
MNPDEPKPPLQQRVPPPPAHLSDEGKREWRRMGKELVRLGLLTSVDKAEFAVYCQSWGRWVEAETALRQYGAVIVTPNKMLAQSPYLAIANRAMADMRAACASFGMSPSSRGKVKGEKPEDRDEFGEMFGT